MWSTNGDIILIGTNNGARMRGSENSSYTCARAAATHPRLSVSLAPGPQARQPRRGAVWPPGRDVPRSPTAPALARRPSGSHGGSESPALAPRTWPHPGPLGRERFGKGKNRAGVGGLGQEGSAGRQELGKKGKELRGGSPALTQSPASGPARDWWRRGPEKPQTRDAPRPEQLEEQLCVR